MTDLTVAFPQLDRDNHELTSPCDGSYNCIAYAAGDTTNWWWPTPKPIGGYYWPPEAPREPTLDAFRIAFEQRGYSQCSDGKPEEQIEKVAIYVNADGRPTHAARQLESGVWTSKLGTNVDIEHATVEAVGGHTGSGYGEVALFMSRPR